MQHVNISPYDFTRLLSFAKMSLFIRSKLASFLVFPPNDLTRFYLLPKFMSKRAQVNKFSRQNTSVTHKGRAGIITKQPSLKMANRKNYASIAPWIVIWFNAFRRDKVKTEQLFFLCFKYQMCIFRQQLSAVFFIITKKTSSPSIIQRFEHREVGTPNCISIFSFIRMISANVFHISNRAVGCTQKSFV